MALFQPVNRSVATMAAVFRVAYATVFMVAIGQLASALTLLDNADQALRAVGDFHTIWGAGYALFSVHLVLIGYLVYRSGFAPKFLGVLLILAGLGYLVDEIGSVLVSGYALDVARFSFVGEAVLRGIVKTCGSACLTLLADHLLVDLGRRVVRRVCR